MKNAVVVIPTYNEIENIEIILEKVFSLSLNLDILVVDDNSPDLTHAKVQELIDNKTYNSSLNLIIRQNKEGLGKAYIEGFKWCLAQEYTYIIEMDADLSHDPKYIPSFLENIKDNDLVIGSRYVKGGGVVNWSMFRKLISFGGSAYSRIILGISIKDVTGGFKCFKYEVLKSINLDNIMSAGYAFQIEMNYRTLLKGFKVKEVPIVFEDRVLGKSKMSKKIFIEALWNVLLLRIHKKDILNEK
ncbi:polyprenol monophosphomannose synthase [Sulfurimonas sp. MAG313]|nr:polyprenol monophosphomannose synthase [Sulfurimonas sp. MAG313]MDF1879759.1 polyprenol monophosphomannose synthase [Sulfurimonas sp. MAG313]